MKEFKWEIIKKDNELWVNLNGGLNRIIDISNDKFKQNVKILINEIEFFKTITKTTIIGKEYLQI